MILCGSTGSIGLNALILARKYNINISALSCGENISLLNEQIQEFKPKFVCIKNENDKKLVKFPSSKIFVGQNGLEKLLKECDDDLVLNAIVGFAGFNVSLTAKKLNKILALANKESLVVGGKFLKGANIRAIDSEHAALNMLLKEQKNIKKILITASGGAFFKHKVKDLKYVSSKDALKHPNWSMGAKITIDSATMANKLFEILEAYYLYGFKNIDAIIEPRSLIHALCEFKDGGTSLYASSADMKLSISQALFEKNDKNILNSLDFLKIPSLKFYKISLKKYPIYSLKDILLNKPDLGVIVNAANEYWVYKFLSGNCAFLDIANGIFKALDKFADIKINEIEEIFYLDKKVKEFCAS
ncbi:1-deoxy-D-xylulose-5-phosphate reductoisomerase [uncultured Campylobacter sp.]|uniref:1-deoxy-D-xylulose-5-phosphate reductoisomerase n=1 Tax=uncultured Campylobacter sp. TaxID=218934 RepID=UPI00261426BA|nr:1-deoxy-D-xylulose-5-phosphate reductoisomerase [uncultured Campylobacter sp.]